MYNSNSSGQHDAVAFAAGKDLLVTINKQMARYAEIKAFADQVQTDNNAAADAAEAAGAARDAANGVKTYLDALKGQVETLLSDIEGEHVDALAEIAAAVAAAGAQIDSYLSDAQSALSTARQGAIDDVQAAIAGISDQLDPLVDAAQDAADAAAQDAQQTTNDKGFVSGVAVQAASTLASIQTASDAIALIASQVASNSQAAATAAQNARVISGLSDLFAAARTFAIGSTFNGLGVMDVTRDVYDPASNGGSWRDVCANASWQAIGKPPMVATIGVQPTALILYSRVDTKGPIYKAWTIAGGSGAAKYGQGRLLFGATGGLYEIDFVRDRVIRWDTAGRWLSDQNVLNYNQTTSGWTKLDSNAISNTAISSIDLFVLRPAPADINRADLLRSLVAVAPGTGINVIRADGVVTSSATTLAVKAVAFDTFGNLWNTYVSANVCLPAHYLVPAFNYAALASFGVTQLAVNSPPTGLTALGNGVMAVYGSIAASIGFIGGGNVCRIRLDQANPANSLFSYKTAFTETGWMVGLSATKCALVPTSIGLGAIDTTPAFSVDFSTYANVAALKADWTVTNDFTNAIQLSGGNLLLTGDGTNHNCSIIKSFPTIAGQTYKVNLPVLSGSGSVGFRVGSTAGGLDLIYNPGQVVGTYSKSFVALGATSYVTLYVPIAAAAMTVGAITVSPCIMDRSMSGVGDHLPTGPLTISAFAAGSDLAGVKGWGAGKYLVGPGIAYGTAGFDEALTIGGADLANGQRFRAHGYWTGGAWSGAYHTLSLNASAQLVWVISDGTNSVTLTSNVAIVAGKNYQVRLIYRAETGNFELMLSGVRVALAARGSVGSLTNASASSYFGGDPSGAFTTATTQLTLMKSSAATPLLDQIAFMHAQEAPLLTTGMKMLLSPAANIGVQTVDFDPDTGQFAVGMSAGGVDIFKGLVRVANDNSATGSVNQFAGKFPDSLTFGGSGGATLGSQVAAFAKWGGAGYQLMDVAASGSHYWQTSNTYLSDGVTTRMFTIPLKSAAVGFAMVQLTSLITGVVNLATGAVTSLTGGAAFTVTALDTGEWLVSVSGVPAAGNQRCYVYSASIATNSSYVGTGAAAIIFGLPMLTTGASVPTTYVDPLSGSPSAKLLAFGNGELAVGTANGLDFFASAMRGLRETATVAPRRRVLDPMRAKRTFETTNATPVNVPLFEVPEGADWYLAIKPKATNVAGGGFTTTLVWTPSFGRASFPVGGSLSAKGSAPSLVDPTSTTAAVAIGFDATTRVVYATLTGLVSTPLHWMFDIEIGDSFERIAA